MFAPHYQGIDNSNNGQEEEEKNTERGARIVPARLKDVRRARSIFPARWLHKEANDCNTPPFHSLSLEDGEIPRLFTV